MEHERFYIFHSYISGLETEHPGAMPICDIYSSKRTLWLFLYLDRLDSYLLTSLIPDVLIHLLHFKNDHILL